MDFFRIGVREIERGPKKGEFEVYPDFIIGRSKDLMVRGRSFYAIWDEAQGLWSTDEYDVQRLVDQELDAFVQKKGAEGGIYHIRYLRSFETMGWTRFRNFVANVSDNSKTLDDHLTFLNTEVKKSDHVSRRLPYSLEPGDYSAWDELVGTLYSIEEREKIEWAIGSIISGDSKKIQKFLVLYGSAGTGKSTILNIVQQLFDGYTTSFEAKALGSNNGTFAMEAFRHNPLVAIQHDGDLSRIEDNTKLNSIVSHEIMTMNEKNKPSYDVRVNAFLLMGTNQPVKISDAKSGIIRRLIDVTPTGVRIPANHYNTLLSQIDFQLGAIAYHCLEVYHSLGKNHYNTYRPLEMMFQTDVFFNYIEAHFDVFKSQNGVSLRQAYSLYKEYCSETGIEKPLPQYKMRGELANYFEEFKDRAEVNGEIVRSYFSGFKAAPFKTPTKDVSVFSLVMEEDISLFDQEFEGVLAQYATEDGIPKERWSAVTTSLRDIDTSKLHYVKVPENHIVIDFDLKDENGNKSRERNLEAASVWPATYAEYSKSGSGIHLHYNWTGPVEVSELNPNYSDGIEIKAFTGSSALRRLLTRCNGVGIAELSSGLPLKEKKVLSDTTIKSEKGLRDLIGRNLRKEIHPGTKSSVDFIHKILDDAYSSGMSYDVTDLRSRIMAFANNSTNQSLMALKAVQSMKFKSDEVKACEIEEVADQREVFYDVEVYPNLFVVCWKYRGDTSVVEMINPSPQEIESLLKFKLIGFNNRRYDNHILYARYMGYDLEQLYKLSQKIIDGQNQAMFGEAYNLSYADIYDFSSKKQSLKKFEIELDVHHLELDIPWDEPVPEELWPKVVAYCANDVKATEVVFEAREQDFIARQILAELSGLTVNDTTQKHTARIIFGNDRRPQEKFIYTNLSKMFPGYEFDRGKSSYREENPSEGGYVYAEPGYYENVAVLDVASMHPTSIEQLNLFGEYTKNFADLKAARIAIKHKDFASAKKMLDGKLAPYLKDETDADALSYALKIVINIVYGLTSAKFDNPFKDPRNRDNIVAKRGALFMIDLKHFVQEQGFTAAHIKTDSIKIPNATPEIIFKVTEFGEKYGYTFEHEATYDKFCLVNDAVYIARKGEKWDAVGAQFQHPYVFKSLFSHQDLVFSDLCETKQVAQGLMYLDFTEIANPAFDYSGRAFVGRTGRFIPVQKNAGGGVLVRVKDDKDYAVTGTKGYFWVEAEKAQERNKDAEDPIDVEMTYFESLADAAVKTIQKFVSFEEFVK